MKLNRKLLFVFILIHCISFSYAATIYSDQDGNWEDSSTWAGGTIPSTGDIVIISGDVVTLNSDRSISRLEIETPTVLGIPVLISTSKLIINNSKLTITETSTSGLVLNSLGLLNNEVVLVQGNGGELNVLGDISMNAIGISNVLINTTDASKIKLGGNINRTASFGKLLMEDNSKIIFNGSSAQQLPRNTSLLAEALGDSFTIKNVSLQSSSSAPFTLEGPMTITDTLEFSTNNVRSTAAAPLIIADNAVIVGASKDGYVQGPIIKKGRTNGVPFQFPVGTSSKYAPLEMSKVSTIASSYTVQYYSDPPPFGNQPEAIVDHISDSEYWEFDKEAGSDPVEITIPFDADSGVNTELTDLVVVGLSATNVWESYGNGGAIKNPDESGTVSSDFTSDPPPFGVIWFTTGSVAELFALPVELSIFNAIQAEDLVQLEWETQSEANSSHFEIQRSLDGVTFRKIGIQKSNGNTTTTNRYTFKDIDPDQKWNYYRLKIIDLDGSFEYSPIEIVKFIESSEIKISPNPVDEMININIEDIYMKEGKVEIFDRNGKLVFESQIEFSLGRASLDAEEININESDVYYLRVTTISNTHLLKFLRIKR